MACEARRPLFHLHALLRSKIQKAANSFPEFHGVFRLHSEAYPPFFHRFTQYSHIAGDNRSPVRARMRENSAHTLERSCVGYDYRIACREIIIHLTLRNITNFSRNPSFTTVPTNKCHEVALGVILCLTCDD